MKCGAQTLVDIPKVFFETQPTAQKKPKTQPFELSFFIVLPRMFLIS
ncbi:hypothetical protein J2X69_004568 [Algoriphagus sp. 4150]|nr:hypothetical protein [Algoriphagus sp. 4150]